MTPSCARCCDRIGWRVSNSTLHGWRGLYPEQQRIVEFGRGPRRRETPARDGGEKKRDLAKAALRGDVAVRGLRKNYAKTAAYIDLTHAERVTALRSVADALAGWDDARLFGDAHLKSALSTEQRGRSREFALEQVTSRFNTYLANVQGPDALGIMVHDQHQAESLKLTSLFRAWHEGGTAFTAIPHLAETPLFVDSSLTLMVQVADLVAYATRRFFDNGETDLFHRFYPRYDRTPGGLLVGLRHFTAKTPCACRVCLDHGRRPRAMRRGQRGAPRPPIFEDRGPVAVATWTIEVEVGGEMVAEVTAHRPLDRMDFEPLTAAESPARGATGGRPPADASAPPTRPPG